MRREQEEKDAVGVLPGPNGAPEIGILTDSAEVEDSLYARVKLDSEITELINLADEHITVLGFTEHGLRHVGIVADRAGELLDLLDYTSRECDLARTAGYLHDIGNVISRHNHGQSGAAMLYTMLQRFQIPTRDLGLVLSAIGNHEESYGSVPSNIAAAVVIADKSDVHRTRVKSYDPNKRDIHDDVNYAVTDCSLEVDTEARDIHLRLTIDPQTASVMNYFQIFLSRMEMCRTAAQFLGCNFKLWINEMHVG